MKPARCPYVFLILILLCSVNTVSGQDQKELDQKRKQLLEEIKTTQKLLKKAAESKSSALTTLQTLQKQLQSREALLNTYQKQILISRKEIKSIDDSIATLNQAIDEKSLEYAATVRKMYRYKKQSPSWIHYISAQGANQLFRKWVYLSQIEEWLEEQRQELIEIKATYEEQKEKKQEAQKTLEGRLQNEQKTAQEIKDDAQKESKLLNQLKSQEAELKAQLKRQQQEKNQLDKEIARLIAEASKKSDTDASTSFAATPEGKAISTAFSKNKGQLPWPVKRGVIVKKFGKQKHPTLSNIYIQNNGVDIATEPEASVFSLFGGEVLGVVEVPGYQNMVLVQHGAFFTVYSRLKEVYVSKGEQVTTGQQLGKAYNNSKEGQTLVHLEIWEDKQKLDPVIWLAGK